MERESSALASWSAGEAAMVGTVICSGGVGVAVRPVVRLIDGVIVAQQSLRCTLADAPLGHAELAAAAARNGLRRDLEVAYTSAALAYAPHTTASVFLSVSLPTLLEAGTAEWLTAQVCRAGVRPEDILVEVSERVALAEIAGLRATVADLRRAGFGVVIDNASTDQARMLMIAEVRPDFITIDSDLTAGMHSTDPRRALVVSLLSFATHIDACIVAAGIQSEEELKALTDLGIQYGQGNHLGGPVILTPAGTADAVTVEASWFSSQSTGRLPPAASASVASLLSNAGGSAATEPPTVSLPQALSSAALALQAEHDPQKILAVIAEQLSLVVPVDDLSIYEADHAHDRFVPAFATGPQASEIMADEAFSLSDGLNGWAFAVGTPQRLGNAGAHSAALTIPNTPFEHESLLLIPLVAGDHKLGMLNCRRLGLHRYSDEDLEAASLFGHIAAAAWHNAQLYEELARRAMTDGLTGLFNSRWLREAGEREIADCRRRGTALSIVLVDLDHFKQINDNGGHAAGDVVLQCVAEELRRTTRAGDAAVRLGGEEFILVLRDADSAGAARVAGELRRALANVPIPGACTGIPQITASIGIASFPEHGALLADLVRAADVAMYDAKRDGRDRVKLALREPSRSGDDGAAVA